MKTENSMLERAQVHRRYLWSLCYRMVGVAADADDLVQETYKRALEKPPAAEGNLKPWLTRVAVNLSRDALRQRKRTGYLGPWLPSPIETAADEGLDDVSFEPASTERRYDLLESVSFAFLLALEALTPAQRAVLLLRDVFDFSVEEVSKSLGISQGNVKVIHHRARQRLEAYEKERVPRSAELGRRTRQVLEQFVSALSRNDVTAVQNMLADSVRLLTDAGKEFNAARVPLTGRARVVTFLLAVLQRGGAPASAEIHIFNGVPGIVLTYRPMNHPKGAPRVVALIELDAEDKIRALYSVMTTRKLAGQAQHMG